jgi:hypothetical protein
MARWLLVKTFCEEAVCMLQHAPLFRGLEVYCA